KMSAAHAGAPSPILMARTSLRVWPVAPSSDRIQRPGCTAALGPRTALNAPAQHDPIAYFAPVPGRTAVVLRTDRIGITPKPWDGHFVRLEDLAPRPAP